ncbi:glycosyltransferase family 4 protein [Natronococcus sp. A-GB7]|uniref:glycosyltransferase family 4 protein n=1 Tax=Natronococcus sp. A-GB7 TaxID=3037649 RepID=UPI00241C3E82|nr:glycosyltransferase family 4 protein [Natronococcus sp. A-GB7]MDG5821322.1 glycosyltransferase family 4 protein [Natronococcus sp. A-GB7]
MSPRPHAPPVGPYSEYRKIPQQYEWSEYTTHHPKFVYFFPRNIALSTLTPISFRRTVGKYAEENFEVPDVVHAGHIFLDGYGMIPYCKDHDLPLFVMGRGATLNDYPDMSNKRQEMVAETLQFSSGIICVSEALAKRAQRIVSDPTKVHVVANGENPDFYPESQREEIRKELNIPREDNLVLFVGEFVERKGLKEMMKVLNMVDLPNTHFIFVGQTGGLRSELRDTILSANIGHESKILWRMSPLALRRLYTAADLVWLPSRAEGRPNVIYEAMASKTPVLATSIGGVTEQVEHERTGVLVPPKSPDSLKKQLEYLLSDDMDLESMGEKGYERLLDKGWTWENHAKKIASIHRESLQ